MGRMTAPRMGHCSELRMARVREQMMAHCSGQRTAPMMEHCSELRMEQTRARCSVPTAEQTMEDCLALTTQDCLAQMRMAPERMLQEQRKRRHDRTYYHLQ